MDDYTTVTAAILHTISQIPQYDRPPYPSDALGCSIYPQIMPCLMLTGILFVFNRDFGYSTQGKNEVHLISMKTKFGKNSLLVKGTSSSIVQVAFFHPSA